jgi:hypothetical protein
MLTEVADWQVADSRTLGESRPAWLLALAFVPIELLLQIGLSVLDPRERAEWGRELPAARSAGSDTRYRTQVLDYSDRTFRHESGLEKRLAKYYR